MPIKILPYIQKVQPKEDEKKKEFVSLIQRPKPRRSAGESRISFILTN